MKPVDAELNATALSVCCLRRELKSRAHAMNKARAPLYLVALIMFVEEDHPYAGNYRNQH